MPLTRFVEKLDAQIKLARSCHRGFRRSTRYHRLLAAWLTQMALEAEPLFPTFIHDATA